MTLTNLLGISLDTVVADRAQVARLMAAAQRNLADYSGDLVPESAVAECLACAKELLAHLRTWLAANKPGLM